MQTRRLFHVCLCELVIRITTVLDSFLFFFFAFCFVFVVVLVPVIYMKNKVFKVTNWCHSVVCRMSQTACAGVGGLLSTCLLNKTSLTP